MYSRKVNILLADKLISELDEAAKSFYMTRSDYIRLAVISRLKYDEDQLFARQNPIIVNPMDQYRTTN